MDALASSSPNGGEEGWIPPISWLSGCLTSWLLFLTHYCDPPSAAVQHPVANTKPLWHRAWLGAESSHDSGKMEFHSFVIHCICTGKLAQSNWTQLLSHSFNLFHVTVALVTERGVQWLKVWQFESCSLLRLHPVGLAVSKAGCGITEARRIALWVQFIYRFCLKSVHLDGQLQVISVRHASDICTQFNVTISAVSILIPHTCGVFRQAVQKCRLSCRANYPVGCPKFKKKTHKKNQTWLPV